MVFYTYGKGITETKSAPMILQVGAYNAEFFYGLLKFSLLIIKQSSSGQSKKNMMQKQNCFHGDLGKYLVENTWL